MKNLLLLFFLPLFFLTYSNYSVAQSCLGNCGGSGFGCWCDDGCWLFGDCCPDMCTYCPSQGPNSIANCDGGGGGTDPIEAGCNIQASICQPGELVGPFTFVPKGPPPAHSCLLWGTGTEAAFIILYITESGPLNLLIEGNNAPIGCLDVSIFRIPNGQDPCEAIYQPGNEIGCNLVAPCEGCAEFGYVFNCGAQIDPPNVVAGDVIMIVVHDYSDAQNSFSLSLAPPGQGAQTGPPDPTITPVGVLCLDDASIQMEAVNMGGEWTGTGVDGSGLFDPSAAGVGVHTIDYSIGTAPCDGQDQVTIEVVDCSSCQITNLTANNGACDPNTDSFTITGQVTFVVPPASGQLIIEHCSGATQTFNAPFTSPLNYTFPNLNADGNANCSITAYFSSLPSCEFTVSPYANEEPCSCIPEDASFSYPSNQYCQDAANPAPIITGVAGGTFSSPGLIIDANTGLINLAGSPAGTYTVSYQTPDPNCFSIETFAITISPLPILDAGINLSVCVGESVTLTATGNATSYTWSNGVTNGVAFTSTVTQTYEVTGTSSAGCVATDDVSVFVDELPSVSAGNDFEVCVGAQITLNGQGANWYTWNNGVIDGVPFVINTTTTYEVIGTDANGCQNSDEITVTVNAGAPIDAGQDQSICEGESILIEASGGVSYTWDNGLGAGQSHTVSPTVTTTYTVDGEDINGCQGQGQVTITVNPNPFTSITGDAEYCQGSTSLLNAGAGFTNYQWSTGATTQTINATEVDNPISVTVSTDQGCNYTTDEFLITEVTEIQTSQTVAICAGEQALIHGNTESLAGIYQQSFPSVAGCDSISTITLVVNDLPIINAGIDQIICIGESIVFNASGAENYTWSNGLANGSSFEPPVGDNTYTVLGIDANGCENTGQFTVDVIPLPDVNAGDDVTICAGESIVFNATGANSYVWDNGVSNGQSFAPTVGTHTYTVIGVDAFGCENTDSFSAIVNAIPTVLAGNDITICTGESVTLTASGAQSYAWDNGVQNGVPFVPTNSGTYTVVGSSNGCEASDNLIVTVIPIPAPDFVGNNLEGCAPLTASFTNQTAGQNNNCVWSFGNGQSASSCATVSSTFTSAGCYDVTLTVTTDEGCTNSLTMLDYVCVEPDPIADFIANPDSTSTLDPNIQFINMSSNASSYVWTFGDGSGASQDISPSHIYDSEPGVYLVTLFAYSNGGCVDSTTRIITLTEDLIFYVPNAFTPDNDQFNQDFKPIMTQGFDPYNYNLLIFNRWGEVMFESNNTEVGWDGTYGGKMAPDGVYTWVITVKRSILDDREQFRGHVTLMR